MLYLNYFKLKTTNDYIENWKKNITVQPTNGNILMLDNIFNLKHLCTCINKFMQTENLYLKKKTKEIR